MDFVYKSQLRVPRQTMSILAVQSFFKTICREMKVNEKIQLELELAIEEALTALFSHSAEKSANTQTEVVLEVFNALIKVTIKTPGRPFDSNKSPDYDPENIEGGLDKLGLVKFILQSMVDSVQWRYIEKEGQEVIFTKTLPDPIGLEGFLQSLEAEKNSSAQPFALSENITYRRLNTYEEAVAVAACAYDIYGYQYKDIIYYPEKFLERNLSGLTYSFIAIDEKGTVYGHSALMKQQAEDKIAEVGASFMLPQCRKGGIFGEIASRVANYAFELELDGVYALSVTDHVATQKISEKYGRISTGVRVGSSPAIFVEGANHGERTTTVLNYRQVAARQPRNLYVPEQYKEIILYTYQCLDIQVNPVTPLVASADEDAQESYFDFYHDVTWNRATINASGGDTVCYKLHAITDILKQNKVDCILLSIDLESRYAPLLAKTATELGYFYSGVFPSSFKDGHDALQLQLLNGITVNPDAIVIYQQSAQAIMDFIKKEAPQVFRGTISK